MPDVRPELIIESPGAETVRIPLDRNSYRLGRSTANELSFPADAALSREHLVFEDGVNGWTVRDIGSRNGTRVNGVRLNSPVRLTHGDQIAAGHLTIRFAAQGSDEGLSTHDVIFVVQEPALSMAPVSVDLKSALEKSTDVAGQPKLGNLHLGALVRAGRELAGHSSLDSLLS